ncbi:hypothetical protein [Polyangium jinanense]|nr:hypothetical protein [Polyangium jinanense]
MKQLTEQRQLQWCSDDATRRGADGRADATTSYRNAAFGASTP